MSCAVFKSVILPTTGIVLLGAILLVLSGFINTGVLLGLSHTLVNKTYNGTASSCTPDDFICITSHQVVTLYNGNETLFLIKWAILLVVIEILKFACILALAYALYRIYLKQLLTDLMLLYTTRVPETPPNQDNEAGFSPRVDFDDTTESDTDSFTL